MHIIACKRNQETNLLAIDRYASVDDKLPCLSGTACKHSTEYSNVQSSFQRCKCHQHVWRVRDLTTVFSIPLVHP